MESPHCGMPRAGRQASACAYATLLLLAVGAAGVEDGHSHRASLMVDCAVANEDCLGCTSHDFCTFVVLNMGGTACVHWKDTKRYGRLLGDSLVPATEFMAAPNGAGNGVRPVVMDYAGDYDAVYRARTLLSSSYSYNGPSCPPGGRFVHAPSDVPSSEWEPVIGPGDKTSAEKEAERGGGGGARFRGGVRVEGADGRSRPLPPWRGPPPLPMRFDTDGVPSNMQGGHVGGKRLRLGEGRVAGR